MIEESLDVAGVELDRVFAAVEDRRGELVILVEDFVGRGVGVRRFILVDVVGGGRGLVFSGRLRIALLLIVALQRSSVRNRRSDLVVQFFDRRTSVPVAARATTPHGVIRTGDVR